MNFEQTINSYFAAISKRDRQAFLDTFSDGPGLLQQDPVGTSERHTKEELGAFFDQTLSIFDSLSITPDLSYPLQSQVALTWTARGRGKNGVEVEFHGIDIFVADPLGKILELRAYWDAASTMALLAAGA